MRRPAVDDPALRQPFRLSDPKSEWCLGAASGLVAGEEWEVQRDGDLVSTLGGRSGRSIAAAVQRFEHGDRGGRPAERHHWGASPRSPRIKPIDRDVGSAGPLPATTAVPSTPWAGEPTVVACSAGWEKWRELVASIFPLEWLLRGLPEVGALHRLGAPISMNLARIALVRPPVTGTKSGSDKVRRPAPFPLRPR